MPEITVISQGTTRERAYKRELENYRLVREASETYW